MCASFIPLFSPIQLSASRLFSSCPSLPDLTTVTNNGIWPTSQIVGLTSDRRKSWTAIEDLTLECAKNSHKRLVQLLYCPLFMGNR